MPQFADRLVARGWWHDERREHRWYAPGNVRIDLLPVGEKARQEKQIRWPVAETRMRVVGYDHVFKHAVTCDLGAGLNVRVVPLVVLALLKIVSYLDDPNTREKDLQDFSNIMAKYEEDGERRFSVEVLESGLDYDSAGAYLLGRDLATLCREEDEFASVERFVQQISDADHSTSAALVRLAGRLGENEDLQLWREVAALARGFRELARPRHS